MENSYLATCNLSYTCAYLNRRPLILLSLFILAVAIRILFVQMFVGLTYGQGQLQLLGGDEIGYVQLATNIAEGKEYASGLHDQMWRTPGYPLFLAFVFILYDDSLAAVRVIHALLGGLACLLIYFIASRTFDATIGFLSAGYFVFYPPHVYMSSQILSENLLMPILLLTIHVSAPLLKNPRAHRLLASGFLLGIGTLVRPESGGLLLVLGLLILCLPPISIRHRIVALAMFLLLFAITLSPWLARNYHISGRLVLSTVGGEAFWGGNNLYTLNDPQWRGYWKPVHEMTDEFRYVMTGQTEIDRDRRRWALGISFVSSHAVALPRLAAYKIRRFYSVMLADRLERLVMIITFGSLMPFILGGVLVNVLRPSGAKHFTFLLLSTIVYYHLLAIVFWGSNRFRLSIDPFLITFGMWAILYLYESLSGWLRFGPFRSDESPPVPPLG